MKVTREIDEITACDEYTWIDGNTYTESTDSPTFTLTNVHGCDSVVTLNLTIHASNTGIDEITACDEYTWIDGNTYTESTDSPTFTLTNIHDCDSVVTLNLTINESNTGIDEITACDEYTWIDGNTYTESTDSPTFTLTNVHDCDSVVTLNLTIHESSTGIDAITACDEYTWIDGNTYTESTDSPTFTLTNIHDCDSVVTLNLTIHESNTEIDEVAACEEYTWIDGNTYTESTDSPTFTLTSVHGCDSVVTLNLTIHESNTGIDEITACDEYTWIDGNTYTESTDSPTFTLTNIHDCDSVVTLNLTINAVDVSTTVDGHTISANLDGASYQWVDCNNDFEPIAGETSQSITLTENGLYAVLIEEGECESMSECITIDDVSVEELFGHSFSIYPNPTNGDVFVDPGEYVQSISISVYGPLGQLIYQVEEQGKSLIELRGGAGLYFVDIISSNGQKKSFKVLKM